MSDGSCIFSLQQDRVVIMKMSLACSIWPGTGLVMMRESSESVMLDFIVSHVRRRSSTWLPSVEVRPHTHHRFCDFLLG
jgi:hypothetical protein